MANATVTVTEAGAGTDLVVLDVGRQAAAASKSLATCTEDKAVLDAIAASLATLDNVVSGNEAQVDVLTINGVAPAFGSGNVGATVQRVVLAADTVNANGQATMANSAPVVIASDDPVAVSLALIDDAIKADDAAFTPGTTKVMMAGFQADESSTDSVDEGDAGAARMTLDRKVITTPQPHTAGGLSVFKSLDLDESEEDVKTSAGQLYGFYAVNRTTSPLYLRFYNATAANVTVGTTAHLVGPIEIPANASDHIALSFNNGGMGIAFDTAISAAVTTGFADNDTGAPGANHCIINVFYK